MERSIDEARGHLVVDYTPEAQQQTASPVLLPLRAQAEPSPTTGIALAPLFHQPVNGREVSFSSPARASSTQSEDRDGLAPGSKHAETMDVSSQVPSQAAASNSPAAETAAEDYVVYVPSQSDKPSLANHDGWQWRKYGEKVVKGNPHPRSYYKCSHVGCGAKKIVERDECGDIISTDYKAEHCHPMPRFAPMRLRTSGSTKGGQRWCKFQPVVEPPVAPPPPPPVPPPARGTRSSSRQLLPIPDSLRDDLKRPGVPSWRSGGTYDEDEGDEGCGSRHGPPLTPPSMAADVPASSFLHEASSSGNVLSPAMRLDVLAAYAEEAERELHEVERASPHGHHPPAPLEGESPGRAAKRRRTNAAAAGPSTLSERRGRGSAAARPVEEVLNAAAASGRLGDESVAATPLGASFGAEECLRWCRSLVAKRSAPLPLPLREFNGRDMGGAGQMQTRGANGGGAPSSYSASSPKAADRQAMPPPPAPPPPPPPLVASQRRIIASENVSDGYRWRKYGQKDLKGSLYPRSYYKCTTVGCPARKYVERLPDSSGRLVMTFEHTHSHPPVPGAAGGGEAAAEGLGELEEAGSAGSDSLPSSPWSGSPRSGLTTSATNLVKLQTAAKALLPYLPLGGVQLSSDGQVDPASAELLEAALGSMGLAGQLDHGTLVALMQEYSPVPEPASLDASSWDPATCLMTPRAPGSAAKRQPIDFSGLERAPGSGSKRQQQQPAVDFSGPEPVPGSGSKRQQQQAADCHVPERAPCSGGRRQRAVDSVKLERGL